VKDLSIWWIFSETKVNVISESLQRDTCKVVSFATLRFCTHQSIWSWNKWTRSSGIGGCIQKFPDWPPGARTANGTPLCH